MYQPPPKPTATQTAMAIIALLDASRRADEEDARQAAYQAVAAYLAYLTAQP